MEKINITSNEANQRVDRFLRKYLKETSLTDIYKLLRKKSVRVNGRGVKENYRLAEGDMLEIRMECNRSEAASIKPAGRDFGIIYEDENILIVDKPAELIIHPDAGHKENTLVDQVLFYLYETSQYDPIKEKTFKPAAVNRLDVNTGGIVLFAKNYASLQALSTMVRDRFIGKYYICAARGNMEGVLDIKSFLTKDTKNNVVKVSDAELPGSKVIHTRFRVLKAVDSYSLVEVDLITGRSHQIRAQLAGIGHPIIGDMKYGTRIDNEYFYDKFRLKNQLLYAYRIVFEKTIDPLNYLEGRRFFSTLPHVYRQILERIFDYKLD